MDHNVTIMNDEDGEDISILSNADYGLFAKQESTFEDPFNIKWDEIRKSEGLLVKMMLNLKSLTHLI